MNSVAPAKVLFLELKGSHLPWLQAAGLIAFWWVMQCLTDALHLPLPGSLVGLLLLWALLETGVLPLGWLEHGADGLLQHLMLFFVPAMLALVDHPELLSMLGVKLIAAVIMSTVIVMAGTACVVELGFRLSHAATD